MKVFPLVLCLVVAGCARPLTNDEIIAEKRKCEANDMNATLVQNTWTLEIVRVICSPKVRRSL